MISVIHATKGREKQATETCKKWLSFADNQVDYILSLDAEDTNHYKELIDSCKFFGTGLITWNSNKNAVEAFNNGALSASGDLLIAISDDTDCPLHWDTLLLNTLKFYVPNFCIKVNDGLQPTLITMPVMDREYYKTYDFIYNPLYSHMFVDQELTAVAIMTGRYLKIDLKFEHLHYTTGKSPKDAINIKNDLTWQQGEALFNERLKTNFGIENPVIPYSEIKWK
jgi:hypothetical protein